MNNHIVIIRFHYEKDSPRFQWRFEYFKNEVLPRLLKQTDSNFDIGIRCNEWHNELFRSLHPRIIPFQINNERVFYKKRGRGKKYFFDFCEWKDVIGLKKYDIQTGLDSDDLIADNYIETIVSEIKKFSKSNPNKSLHICFQPELFNYKTKEIYSIGQTYGPRDGSAFMSMYQPDKINYHFIYERSHHYLYQLVSSTIIIPKGYCWATVHDYNESTGKKN
jgi:hypothetical protein